jgi:hypothetical protein
MTLDQRAFDKEVSMPAASNRSVPSFAFAVLLAAPFLLSSPAVAFPAPGPATPPKTPTAATAKAEAVKIAVTPEDHLAKGIEYMKKAIAYRAEAAVHRKMLEEYSQKFLGERVDEDPFVTKMRVHCERFIKDAEALAADAEKFADFHRMRAGELQGK